MKSTDYVKTQMVINVREVIWDLLEQWKAMLIIALAVMLLVSGAKYIKDVQAAEEAGKAVEAAAAEAEMPEEELINKALETVPESERAEVTYTVTRRMWLEQQKAYLSDSILMNLDASNERVLSLNFSIRAEAADTAALESSYNSFASDKSVIEKLRPLIKADAEDRFIAELIRTEKSNTFYNAKDFTDGAFEIQIVIPDEADAEAIADAVGMAFADYSKILAKSVAKHELKLTAANETVISNALDISNKGDLMNRMYTLQNNLKNENSTLSDAQKAAVDTIVKIRKAKAESKDTAEDEAEAAAADSGEVSGKSAPSFSKKYAVLGFMLGMIGYALAYLLLIILRGCVNSASEAELYTGSRLLGEIYRNEEKTGLKKMLSSKFVDSLRYKGKLDEAVQMEKFSASLDAVCEHADVRELTLLNLTGLSRESEELKVITDKAGENGISVDTVDMSGDIDEKKLLNVKNAVMAVSNDTKVSGLVRLAGLCGEYTVSMLGNVYIK